MKRPRQLTADTLDCPYCGSDNVIVKQMGHFVNTLLLICFGCQKSANFKGPEVTWTKELRDLPVLTNFREPTF